MHSPFTSEISVERKHVLLITVIKKMRYFYFLMSVKTCIRPPTPAPPFTHLTVLTQERYVRKKEKLPKCSR